MDMTAFHLNIWIAVMVFIGLHFRFATVGVANARDAPVAPTAPAAVVVDERQ